MDIKEIDVKNLLGIDSINFLGTGQTILKSILLFFIIILCLGVGYFIITRNKKKKGKLIKKIGWWEEIQGNMTPLKIDEAEEITIPNTNLKAFYIKKFDMWLPRFTIPISQDLFYVCITKTREIINFKLKSLSKDLKEANLEYDHTDMRWANENLAEHIKRNYRDKAVKWWREYKDVIQIVIFVMVMTLSLVIVLLMMSNLAEKIGEIGKMLGDIVSNLQKNQVQNVQVGVTG